MTPPWGPNSVAESKGAPPAHTCPSAQNFPNFMRFFGNVGKKIRLALLREGWRPLLWGILDPALKFSHFHAVLQNNRLAHSLLQLAALSEKSWTRHWHLIVMYSIHLQGMDPGFSVEVGANYPRVTRYDFAKYSEKLYRIEKILVCVCVCVCVYGGGEG